MLECVQAYIRNCSLKSGNEVQYSIFNHRNYCMLHANADVPPSQHVMLLDLPALFSQDSHFLKSGKQEDFLLHEDYLLLQLSSNGVGYSRQAWSQYILYSFCKNTTLVHEKVQIL